MSLALDIIGMDLTAGAFASVLGRLSGLDAAAAGSGGNGQLAQMANNLKLIEGAAAGAGIAFLAFKTGLQYAIDAGAALQNAGVMASIAISDGSQHVGELESAIVNLANTSQYKIADVDMAFRVLGGLGFTTGQILGGLGQQAIVLAQAMGGPGAGVSAADAAQLLGQAIYIFGQKGLTASHAADVLTGAFYNNMMSVSDLQQYLGMAGGTAAALGVSFDSLMTFGSLLTPMFGSASSAGASLSYMMRNLAHPATAAMADEIRKLGLQIYDSKGNFVGLKSIMDQLFEKTSTMTQQQKMDVFGTLFNVRSGRAAMDLMNQTQSSFDAEYNRIDSRLTQTGQAQRDSTAINNTAIGAWNRLTTTVNDFFAVAGKTINQALIPFYNWLNSIFSALQNNAGFEQFLAILLPVGTALSGLALAGAAVAGAIILLGPVLGVAALVLASILSLSAGVAAAIYVLSSKAHDLGGAFAFMNPLIDFARSMFADLWGSMQQNIAQMAPLLPLLKFIGGALLFLGVVLPVAALVALGLAVLGVVNFLTMLGAGVGKAVAFIQQFGKVFADVGTLLHDFFTGQWQKMAGDVENIQRDFNATMQSLQNQQVDAAKKAADKETANATAAALDKEAKQYQATATGDEKLRAQAQSQADYYQNLANTTKDKSLVTQYQQQAQMYQAQANGYAQQRDLANQNANALTAQANQVKANMTAISQSTMTAVVNNASDMSSKTTAQVRGMTSQTHAYMNEMRSDAITQAQQMSNGVAAQMQATANAAGTWGNDMANNFANGFSIGASSAESAAQRMAAKMAATLGHSKPTEGPLVDDDVWGLHMAQNFATGLLQGVGLIGGAATQVAQAAAGALGGVAPTLGGGAVPTPGLLVGGVGGGGQTIILPIYIGQDLVAQYGYNTITQQLTMQGIGRQFR